MANVNHHQATNVVPFDKKNWKKKKKKHKIDLMTYFNIFLLIKQIPQLKTCKNIK